MEELRRRLAEAEAEIARLTHASTTANDARDAAHVTEEIAGTDKGTDPFAAAVRATRMPMVVTDPRQPDNPIVFVNDAFCKLTGYSRSEIVGQNCRFLQGPETDPETVARLRNAVACMRSIELDIRNHKKDGTPFWNRLLMAPVKDAEGTLAYFFASQLDVTLERERLLRLEDENASLTAERNINQARLTFSEESLRLATEAAEVGTWDLDLTTDVLTWSDRTKAMFGISPNVPCSMPDFYSGLHPNDREATTTAFASALDPDRRATYDVEYRTIGKNDGVVRWVAAKGKGLFDDHGRCVRALGTAIDVTARKEIEERLRRNETELRDWNATLEKRVAERTAERNVLVKVFESTDAFIMVVDLAYIILAINKSNADEFERIYGVRPKPGDHLLELLADHPEHRSQVEAGWSRALAGEEFTFVEDFGDPDRDRPYYEIKFNTLHDDAGERIGAYNIVYDVTERLRNQAELAESQDALRQSQKMEAVGQLTGGLAHDFNNLLTGISGSLELLGSRVRHGRFDEVERYVGAAQGAAKRAAALTHRLLAFSRRQTLDPKPTDVRKLVVGMADLIRRTVGPEITVETVDMVGLWPALVDPPQLENALLNLCINARDAMPDGGRITIETANRWFDERGARDHDLPPGQYLSLCVSDTGTGMPPDVIARAFDPFFTTKPLGQGTGLGLSMIYGFVRQSGGQVRIYSELGQGTMVCIYLPRHCGEGEDLGEVETHADEAPRAIEGETVLVIDDEPTVRMLVSDVLSDLGYGGLEAEDGPSGLKILQSQARIDLLITDVGLPGGMNGRQVADAARLLRPGLKVLFITGYAENAVVGNGYLDPGMQILTKPFAVDDLAGRIRAIIERRDAP